MSDHSLSSWMCNHLHVHVSFYIVSTTSRSDLMSFAVYDRYATGEACFGFILSFSCFIFVCFEHSACATPITIPMSWRKKKASVCMETSAVSATKPKIVRKNQSTRPPHLLSQPYHEVEVCRGREAPEAKVTMGPFFDNRADYLKGTCARTPCEHWHPPECQFCKSETVC